MTSALYDSVARIARHEASARAVAAVGVVTDLFDTSGSPADHAVTVELRDSGLALPRVPVAVGALGFAALPAVGDLVVVLFLEGDVNAPLVVGRLYHPDLEPPADAKAGKLVLALPAGEAEPKLRLVVDGAAPKIELHLPSDVLVEIDDGVVKLAVGQNEELRVKVEAAGGGRVEIAAGSSKITLKQDGDVTVSAGGNLKLEANEIDISGSGKVKVSGAQVEIN
jgi:phage baseplate assembly protein gpV